MTDPSDTTIDNLVSRLTPVRRLRDGALWQGALVALVLAALYVFFLYGARPELAGLMHGNAKAMVWLKPLIFLIIGLSSLWAVTDLARPEGRLRVRMLIPPIVVAGALIGDLARDISAHGLTATIDNAFGAATLCALTIFCGGAAGLVVMWRFWLRRTASSYPVSLGAMSGLAAASLMAAAYAIHCNMDAPVYILMVYGLAVAAFTGVSAVLGRWLLRW